MSGPEKVLQDRVMSWLKTFEPDMWAFKSHDQCTSGVPDIHGCYKGKAFYIELKAPGEKPAVLQNYVMDRIERAGGRVGRGLDTFSKIQSFVKKLINT